MSMAEIVYWRLETMVDAVSIPLIADADTGYGNPLNAQHAVKAFQRARCCRLSPRKIKTSQSAVVITMTRASCQTMEMTQKIKAVKDASEDPDFILIARTDGLAVEGYDKTIDRAHAYMDAGADVIFFWRPRPQ